MKPNINKLLNSREYKLILKANNFIAKENGRKKIVDILTDYFEKQKGKFSISDSKAIRKRVWYMDTANLDLHEKHHFLLRIREEYDEKNDIKEYDITFKNRDLDRPKAASFDLSGFQENLNFKFKENKFEEDIVTPFESNFSVSTKFKSKENPNFVS